MANETPTTQSAENTAQNAEALTPVTDPKATIKLEGQSFEVDARLAQQDTTLKAVLQPHFSAVENANITREVKDGKLTVTIVKKAQHKGSPES